MVRPKSKATNRHELLGRAIRRERRALKLTQTELSKLAGVRLNFVSQLERGKPTVRFNKLVDVIQVLGLELLLQRGKSGTSVERSLSRED